jgi:large subunit ribosomal protein L31
MKPDIHPKYFTDAKATCVCGNTFTVGSVLQAVNVDICAECHPFFSGKQKLVDTEGRAEKFKKKYASFLDKKTT